MTKGILGGSGGKESACNVGDFGSGRSPRKGMATHSSILAWRIPQTEEPFRIQSMRLRESDATEQLSIFHFSVE